MGFFLDGYLGQRSQLQQWHDRLPSAAVCPLNGELALVPLTGHLQRELPGRALDWAIEASKAGPVIHFSMGEFGDQSHEHVWLCSEGAVLSPLTRLRSALEFLRTTAGIPFDVSHIDLEKYRGESAAEKWVAASCAE